MMTILIPIVAFLTVLFAPVPFTKAQTSTPSPNAPGCTFQTNGSGPKGTVPVQLQTVVSGLEVPWGIAFLPNGDWLVTERPGRIRLVRKGQLLPASVATVQVGESSEGGLLGIALHPSFTKNSLFYVYATVNKPNGNTVNQIQRYKYDANTSKATLDKVIYDDIPSYAFHNGGRLRFGPDGMLYASTGDAGTPDNAQNPGTPAGKVLRLTPEGQVPSDNPLPGNPLFVQGIRNVEAFDWIDHTTMILADNGPTADQGEGARTGGDEIDVAHAGDNLGWPTLWHCEGAQGFVPPILSWESAVPPGGGAIYHGTRVPEFQGNFLIGAMRAQHLHRVVLSPQGTVVKHEVYFQNQFGRLREVINGPDGELYVTTTNCDSRGDCPPEQDKILKLTRAGS